MPACMETDFSKNFYSRLISLRNEVKTLPKKHRFKLRELADQIGLQHLNMQDDCDDIVRMADELRVTADCANRKLFAGECGKTQQSVRDCRA